MAHVLHGHHTSACSGDSGLQAEAVHGSHAARSGHAAQGRVLTSDVLALHCKTLHASEDEQ